MTACGCFECIVMYIPEVEGVMVVSREDINMTPAGMKFSTLAGVAGGGVQTPGVMGVGKYYLVSPKFISADGGFKRVVWMSRILKETMAAELQHVAEREGIPDLIDRIADGSQVTDVEQLQDWVEEVRHPVMEMGPMVTELEPEPELRAAREEELMAQATAVVEEAMAKQAAESAEVTSEPAAAETDVAQVVEEVAKPLEAPLPIPIPVEEKAPPAPVAPEPERVEEAEIVQVAVAEKAAELVSAVEQPATQSELLQKAQEAALRQAQALQQAAAEAMRQAELLGQARAIAATPASPAAAVDALRQALQAALGALGSASVGAPPPPLVVPPEPVAAPKEVKTAPPPPPVKLVEPEMASPSPQPPAPKPRAKRQADPAWLAAGTKTPLAKEKWAGKVREITLGATSAAGGTRARAVTIGGETAMPFMHFEGETPHPPVIAFEIKDSKPQDWSALLLEAWDDLVSDPARWATAAEQAGASLIQLSLSLANTPETAVATVRSVLQATGLPLIVVGPGQADKDNELLVPIAEAFKGERLALGVCEDKNYRTIVAAAMANDHVVIARTAMDVNLAKQLNILISDMGLPLDRIIMDPTTGALGYGFEYGYSVMERLRLAALQGDTMTQLPMLVTPGEECWKTKEAKVGQGVPAEWGEWRERAVTWETLTATMLIESGANIVVLRHPESAKRVTVGNQRLDE